MDEVKNVPNKPEVAAKRPNLKLKVALLNPAAKLPTVAHPGEDLAYDLYSAEEVIISPGSMIEVHTGIAIEFSPIRGAVIKDRSSMAKKRLLTSGGVIDAGYRGEIIVFIENKGVARHRITVGDKIAQMIPIVPQTDFEVVAVTEGDLGTSTRGEKGFGSSGK